MFIVVEVGDFDMPADSSDCLAMARGSDSTGVRERGSNAEGTSGT